MAKWLACLATKPENLDRFPGAHLFSVYFFFSFKHLKLLLLHTSKMAIPELFILNYA